MKIKIIIGMKIINSLIACLLVIVAFGQNSKMIDPRDGKEYKTVQIGRQVWMAQNLAYTKQIPYANGANPEIKKNEDEYIFCYGHDTTSCKKYGMLYSWKAAQNSCPSGWHLPSVIEFEAMLSLFGESPKDRYKVADDRVWGSSDLFSGMLLIDKVDKDFSLLWRFRGLYKVGVYWTSTEKGKGYAYRFAIINPKQKTNTMQFKKSNALSVRCIKD